MTEILRPCPFCGGEAERITLGPEEPENEGGDVIVCKGCQASSRVEFGYKENLVSSWNERTCPTCHLGGCTRGHDYKSMRERIADLEATLRHADEYLSRLQTPGTEPLNSVNAGRTKAERSRHTASVRNEARAVWAVVGNVLDHGMAFSDALSATHQTGSNK